MRHVGRAFDELRRGLEMVSTRGPQLLRLHSAPSFAALWLSPRLARFLRDHPGIEVRLAAGTDYTRFLNDEFDADIVYGLPRLEGLVVVPLGEETVTPLCTPDLARDDQDTDGPVQPRPDRERDQAGPLVRLVRAQRTPGAPAARGSFRPKLPCHRRRRRRPRRDPGIDTARRARDRERTAGASPGRARRGRPLRRAPSGLSAQHAPASQLAAVHEMAGRGAGPEGRSRRSSPRLRPPWRGRGSGRDSRRSAGA